MVTFNVADFARIATEWAAEGRSHAGCLLIVGIDHAEFGLILRVIEHALASRPNQRSWLGYTVWGTRSTLRNADTTTPPHAEPIHPGVRTKGHTDPPHPRRDQPPSIPSPEGTAPTLPSAADAKWTRLVRHDRSLQNPINGDDQ